MKINKERFKEARLAKKLSQAQVAKALKISQPLIFKLEAGELNAFSNIKQVLKLAEIFEIQPAELIEDEDADFFKKLFIHPHIKLITIPLLTFGDVLAYIDHHVLPTNARSINMSANNIPLTDNTFAIEIEGDAMISMSNPSESFYPSEIAIIDYNREYKSGDVVLAYLEKVGLKVRQFVKDGSECFLKAFNPSYEKNIVTKNTRILGVVIMTHKIRVI